MNVIKYVHNILSQNLIESYHVLLHLPLCKQCIISKVLSMCFTPLSNCMEGS